MAKYAISFRIDVSDRGGYSYGERYGSFMEQVRKTEVWEETTSFALTTSYEGIEEFADRLFYKSHFNAVHDTMLVIDIDLGMAVSRGIINYPATLRSKLNTLIQK